MHAGHGDGFLAGLTVLEGHDAPPVHTPGHLVLVLTGGDATVAFDTTLGIAKKFHTCHK
jgi:hypothetical protein